jgi:hypothetical protein
MDQALYLKRIYYTMAKDSVFKINSKADTIPGQGELAGVKIKPGGGE